MKPRTLFFIYVLTAGLFLGCFRFGLLLAKHKPLWNDEIYTQMASVRQKSYADMLLGRIKEGNNTPLFYIIQKGIGAVFQYQTPDLWKHQTIYDRILLRVNPVFFMSLSITAIFFYFSRFHSLLAGGYSLFLTASSFMVWTYWAEARPYGLWVFLTTLQALLFLHVSRHGKPARIWMALTVVHVLLSLTSIFSLAQIVIVSFLLWILGLRGCRKYLFLTGIPSLIALFYYFQAPQYQFWFDLSPEQLIRDCFSRDRFYILFIYMFFIPLYLSQQKIGQPKLFKDETFIKGLPFLGFTLLMLLAAFALLFIFKWGESDNRQGFPIASRYFIYLTPVGIIATTFLSITIFKGLSANRWVQALVSGGMGYLVIHRFWKMTGHIQHICKDIF